MNYINVSLLKSRNLSLHEFAILCLLRQNKFENNLDILETELNTDVLKKFEDLNLIEQVKRKNKAQNEIELIRTSKKGSEWIEDISTAELCEDTLKIYNWIENIYLNGTMLGYSRNEIDEKIDAILKFADIGEFINQTIKTYLMV